MPTQWDDFEAVAEPNSAVKWDEFEAVEPDRPLARATIVPAPASESPTVIPNQMDEWLRPSGAHAPLPPRFSTPTELAENVTTSPTRPAPEEPIPDVGGGIPARLSPDEWERLNKKIALGEEGTNLAIQAAPMEGLQRALYTPIMEPGALAMPESEKGPLAAELKSRFPDQLRAPSVIQPESNAERESETFQRSIAEGLSGMTTGEQLAILGAAGASGKVGGAIGQIAEKAIPATFGVEGVKGTFQGAKHLLGANTPEERGQAQAEIAMSAPMIAGVGALFKSHPSAPIPERVKTVIRENAAVLPKAAEAAAKAVQEKSSDTKASASPANDTLPPKSEVVSGEQTPPGDVALDDIMGTELSSAELGLANRSPEGIATLDRLSKELAERRAKDKANAQLLVWKNRLDEAGRVARDQIQDEPILQEQVANVQKRWAAKEIPDDWQISVTPEQELPEGGERMPGNVQVVDPGQTDTSKSPTLESLRAAGYNVPDFQSLPKGKYTVKQAREMLAPKPEPATEKPDFSRREVIPGTTHPAPANSIVIQVRDLDSNPIGPILTAPYDGNIETALRFAQKNFPSSLRNHTRASVRESVLIVTDDKGFTSARIKYDPRNGAVTAQEIAPSAVPTVAKNATVAAKPDFGEVPEAVAKKTYYHGSPFPIEGAPSIRFGGNNYGRRNQAIFLSSDRNYADFFSKKILINKNAPATPSVSAFALAKGNYKHIKSLPRLNDLDRVFDQIAQARNEGYDGVVWANGKEAAVFRDDLIIPKKETPSAFTTAANPADARAAFTARLKEYGEQLGFIHKPDDVHGWTGGSSKSGQSGASVKAKVRHDREMAASCKRAITDLGGDPAKPDFAALNAELEKRIADYQGMEAGAHTPLEGNESTEFLPGDAAPSESESVAESLKKAGDEVEARQAKYRGLTAALPDGTNISGWVKKTLGNDVVWMKGNRGTANVLVEAGRKAVDAALTKQSEMQIPEAFKLTGEEVTDQARIDAEKAQAEADKAAAAKNQMELPGTAAPTSDIRPPTSGKGLAGSVRKKWTSATDSPLGGEGGFITLGPIEDFLESVTKGVKGMSAGAKNAFEATKAAAKENFELAKTSDYRRAILHWSAKMQRSFSEAAQAQHELQQVIKDPKRRDGATNWIQADGDPAVLRQRLAATQAWRDPVTGKPHPEAKRLIAGYEAALNLTPEEIAAATDAKNAYDALGARGQSYDVLKSFKDNYVTQVWDIKKGPTGGNKGFGFGARMLKERFRFAKASTFPTYFDGEQAGFVPKSKDISRLLPMYLHEMNNVIAARQLVEQLAKGTASDGRPLLAPRGAGVAVDNAAGKATLIMPDAMKADSADYVRMENQPALHDWRWQAKDAAGNPVFMKSDLMVHPEAADKFKNVLGRSAIKELLDSKTTAVAEIPKSIGRFLDRAQSETKRTMLGLLSPFHQVQEGTHAVGHRVNPFFNNPKIDLVHNATQMDAARHGLMLQPDRVSAEQFMEGFKHSGLISKVPGVGPVADWYAHYLFHEYIPGIKFKTYEAIRERNMKVFEKDLAAGKVSPEDVKILSAEQANAAYGHLNYADLGRSPTMQHFLRLALLAPDFLEARGKFAAQALKGATGAKVGREQLVALATLAVAQATLAYVSAKITGGQWDAKDPFAFHLGNRKFTMRSVPEDAYRFATDTRAFTYARLNPLIGRGTLQYLSGVDWRGKKVTAGETTKELLQQPVPLTLRPLFGIGNTPLSGWEELAGAAGLKIQRYSNVAEVSKLAHTWMEKSDNPRIKAAEKQHQQETLPDSAYKPLREALLKDDEKAAREALEELLKIRKYSEIAKAMHAMRPFTGSLKVENQFRRSLTAEEKLQYEAARREQRDLYNKFRRLKKAE